MPAVAPLLAACLLGAGPTSPVLRHQSYLAFLPSAATTAVRFDCRAHGDYPDRLRWSAVVGEGEELARGLVDVGQSRADAVVSRPGQLTALLLDSGWNVCTVSLDEAPWALVCHETSTLSVIGLADLWLWQLPGGPARLSVGASVTGEGCRVLLTAGDVTLSDESGDFDRAKPFSVPATATPRAVRLQILKPELPRLALDDVELTVQRNFAPYLAPTAAFAETLGSRWAQWAATHPVR